MKIMMPLNTSTIFTDCISTKMGSLGNRLIDGQIVPRQPASVYFTQLNDNTNTFHKVGPICRACITGKVLFHQVFSSVFLGVG